MHVPLCSARLAVRPSSSAKMDPDIRLDEKNATIFDRIHAISIQEHESHVHTLRKLSSRVLRFSCAKAYFAVQMATATPKA